MLELSTLQTLKETLTPTATAGADFYDLKIKANAGYQWIFPP